jgi:hypothetical protein
MMERSRHYSIQSHYFRQKKTRTAQFAIEHSRSGDVVGSLPMAVTACSPPKDVLWQPNSPFSSRSMSENVRDEGEGTKGLEKKGTSGAEADVSSLINLGCGELNLATGPRLFPLQHGILYRH